MSRYAPPQFRKEKSFPKIASSGRGEMKHIYSLRSNSRCHENMPLATKPNAPHLAGALAKQLVSVLI